MPARIAFIVCVCTMALLAVGAPSIQAAPPAQATADAPVDATPDACKDACAPETVKATVDSDLTDYLAKLLAFQADYFKTHGQFFQALDSHTTPPEDGKLVAPDKLNDGPTNQVEKAAYLWQQLTLDAALPYSARVDVYQGPQGWGYVVTVSAVLEKVLWERSLNTGPETWRDQPWQAVVEESAP